MDDGHNIDKQFVDRSWNEMESLLDRELPVKERKRRFFIWLFMGTALLLIAFFMYQRSGTRSQKAAPIYVEKKQSSKASSNQILNVDGTPTDQVDGTSPNQKQTSLNSKNKSVTQEVEQKEKTTVTSRSETAAPYVRQEPRESTASPRLYTKSTSPQGSSSTDGIQPLPKSTEVKETASHGEDPSVSIPAVDSASPTEMDNLSKDIEEKDIERKDDPNSEDRVLMSIESLVVSALTHGREAPLMTQQVIVEKSKTPQPIRLGVYMDVGRHLISDSTRTPTAYGLGIELRHSYGRLGWSGHLGYQTLQSKTTSDLSAELDPVGVNSSPDFPAEMDFSTPELYDVQTRLDYLYVDLLMEYHISKRINIEIGPQANFRLGGRSVDDFEALKDSRIGASLVSKNELYRRTIYGVKLGASLSLTQKWVLYGQYGYGQGIYRDIGVVDNTFAIGSIPFNGEFRNTVSQLSLGMRLRL